MIDKKCEDIKEDYELFFHIMCCEKCFNEFKEGYEKAYGKIEEDNNEDIES